MDELAREYYETQDPKFQKRFLNWLGGYEKWIIEGAGLSVMPRGPHVRRERGPEFQRALN
jgi:hypothetical protein